MGRLATELLLKRISGELEEYQELILPTEIVEPRIQRSSEKTVIERKKTLFFICV